MDDFLAHGLKGRGPGTITHARSMAENQIKPKIGNYRLKDLRAEHVDLWLDELASTLATKTIVQVHSLLTRDPYGRETRTRRPQRLGSL
ncbi:tyrosine-type recombinase/integrase [Nonomuraea indica]|uniref:Integrase SAM-like N-terminal domain-containing protein n=1 Tax=Nonomuraea indica TaxID=1581193 RepID=A0ABW8AAI8_9ACTN